jgi:immune inhibitor A
MDHVAVSPARHRTDPGEEERTMTSRPNPVHADPLLQRCLVAPSPEARERLRVQLDTARAALGDDAVPFITVRQPTRIGMNDGVIIPGTMFPLGAAPELVRSAAARRNLRGIVRVIVVLVDFPDKQFAPAHNQQHFRDLFFSTGVIPTGSVHEYYQEVTHGLVDIRGEVVGPFRMPQPITFYANGKSGAGNNEPNARTLARAAAKAADPSVNFGPYDNDQNGFVDAFIVVHAGRGAEETLKNSDLWSLKWVLAGGEYNADSTKIFGFLTVPEDAKIGVCSHELGHLLFGFPDLYDTDDTSEGIGNWCLMAAGSWGGHGDRPVHPSAWCKAGQGWVTVSNRRANTTVTVKDVKDSHKVLRLWRNGAASKEYFLVENRQRTGFDGELPGQGLLIWHIDDTTPDNENENHYKVALVQADNQRDLENAANRGDAADAYPGTRQNTTFDANSAPNSNAYSGLATSVAVTNIPASSAAMAIKIRVR